MSTLTDTPEFTANEIYEIESTDPVEGAAAGASYGGIGVSNQPHQQLANRTAFLKGRQDTNIGNIASLQSQVAALNSFMGEFSGLLAENGYAWIGLGAQKMLVQWGMFAPTIGITGDTVYTVAWPTAFPTVCIAAFATPIYSNSADLGVGVQADQYNNPQLTIAQGTFFVNRFNVNGYITGFYWLAIGW